MVFRCRSAVARAFRYAGSHAVARAIMVRLVRPEPLSLLGAGLCPWRSINGGALVSARLSARGGAVHLPVAARPVPATRPDAVPGDMPRLPEGGRSTRHRHLVGDRLLPTHHDGPNGPRGCLGASLDYDVVGGADLVAHRLYAGGLRAAGGAGTLDYAGHHRRAGRWTAARPARRRDCGRHLSGDRRAGPLAAPRIVAGGSTCGNGRRHSRVRTLRDAASCDLWSAPDAVHDRGRTHRLHLA